MIIIETENTDNNVGYTIEDINLGDFKIYKTTYSKKIHSEFANFSGDKSKIHTDKSFCERNGYKGVIGYAFFLNTLLSNIFGMNFPGGTELCIRDISNYRVPFYIGEKLTINIKVININKDFQLLTLKKEIFNQNQKLILDGETLFKLSLQK
jgi:3-hydroxybutyryl-CoA dehydratase